MEPDEGAIVGPGRSGHSVFLAIHLEVEQNNTGLSTGQ